MPHVDFPAPNDAAAWLADWQLRNRYTLAEAAGSSPFQSARSGPYRRAVTPPIGSGASGTDGSRTLSPGAKEIRTHGPTLKASVPRAPHGSRHCSRFRSRALLRSASVLRSSPPRQASSGPGNDHVIAVARPESSSRRFGMSVTDERRGYPDLM